VASAFATAADQVSEVVDETESDIDWIIHGLDWIGSAKMDPCPTVR